MKSLLPPAFRNLLPPRAVAQCESPADASKEEAKYYNFSASQKFTYPVEPPLWDSNWDGLKEESVSRRKVRVCESDEERKTRAGREE